MSAYYSTVRRAAVVVCNALAAAAPWIGCAAAQALELGSLLQGSHYLRLGADPAVARLLDCSQERDHLT